MKTASFLKNKECEYFAKKQLLLLGKYVKMMIFTPNG